MHISQFESSRFLFFSWKAGRRILGIGKPGWEGLVLLLLTNYKFALSLVLAPEWKGSTNPTVPTKGGAKIWDILVREAQLMPQGAGLGCGGPCWAAEASEL